MKVMNGLKYLRLAAVVSTLVVMFASVTVVYGGLRWAGMDPIVNLDDSQINITVFWPPEHTCSIDDPIKIGVIYPADITYAQRTASIQGNRLQVELPPATTITLDLGTTRFVNRPSSALPWT